MNEELTDRQADTIDALHNTIYNAMCDIAGLEPEWDMEWIGPIADQFVDYAVEHLGCDEMEIYPYI